MSDYIKREEVIAEIKQEIRTMREDDSGYSASEWVNGLADAISIIEDMATSDVRECVNGKWIDNGVMLSSDMMETRCSVCGNRMIQSTHELIPYCPYCGAYMRGNSDEYID